MHWLVRSSFSGSPALLGSQGRVFGRLLERNSATFNFQASTSRNLKRTGHNTYINAEKPFILAYMASEIGSRDDFRYERLEHPDSIRILQLQPSRASSSEIHCKLVPRTLSECDADLLEHYIALSYVWGSQEDLQSISVDGQLFKVTKNLKNALCDLQDETRAVVLWVDAICINQQDIEERNQQVALMGFIYTIARHTVIYLGESSDQIAEVLRYISRQEEAANRRKIKTYVSMTSETPSFDLIRSVAREILTRPWFNRVWVFQELVLSQDPRVQCGTHRVKWESFCSFLVGRMQDIPYKQLELSCNIPAEHQQRDLRRLQSLDDARTKYQLGVLQGTPQQDLMELLSSRRGYGVTDPRDIIYGHLGVAGLPPPPNRPNEIEYQFEMSTEPDYGKTVSQVLNEFANDVLEWSQSYQIFSFIENIDPSQRREGLAFWAPDWTTDPFQTPQRINPEHVQFRAKRARLGPLAPLFELIPGSHHLVVVGEGKKVLSSVSQVIPWDASEIIDLSEANDIFSKDFGTWYKSLPDKHQAKRMWQHCSVLYDEALRSNPKHPRENAFRIVEPYLHLYDAIQLLECYVGKVNLTWKSIHDLLFLHTFQEKSRSILGGRRIALTDHGDYAIVPAAARSGDVISIFTEVDEKKRPPIFVVRPCGDQGSRPEGQPKDIRDRLLSVQRALPQTLNCGNYTLVGECSVQEEVYKYLRTNFHILVLH